MEKEKDGVWRTIRGRRIFIASGESLGQAMSKSGKFKRENLMRGKRDLRLEDRMSKYQKARNEYAKAEVGDKGKKHNYNKAYKKLRSREHEDLEYDYNYDNPTSINQRITNIDGKTRVERNIDNYKAKDRREIAHENLQKKLADYRNKKGIPSSEEFFKWREKRARQNKEDRQNEKNAQEKLVNELLSKNKNLNDWELEQEAMNRNLDKNKVIAEYKAKKQSNNKIDDETKKQLSYLEKSIKEDKETGNTTNRMKAIEDQQRYDRLYDKYKENGMSDEKIKNLLGDRPKTGLENEELEKRYGKQSNNKVDPYDDPESEESQRMLSIQSRYDEYLQDTEGRGASYGELAHIQGLRGKKLDDFEKELDDYETEKYNKQDTIKNYVEKKKSNNHDTTNRILESGKVNQKTLKSYAKDGLATDISNYSDKELDKLEKKHGKIRAIKTTNGVYGMNGGLFRGEKSGEYFVITSRSGNLYRLV